MKQRCANLLIALIPKVIVVLLCLGAALITCHPAQAAVSKDRVVMVIIDRLSLEDFNNPELKHLPLLIREGGFGLMNTGTGGIRNEENAYATVGAGARALATKAGAFAYGSQEQCAHQIKAFEQFEQRTGIVAQPENVLVLDIAQIIKNSSELPHPVIPGALGEELKNAGCKVGCLGNADWREKPGRQVATVAMDRTGVVGSGYVGRDLLLKDPVFPGSWRTDYGVLWEKWLALKDEAEFIVIELGDTSRLNEAREEVMEDVFQRQWHDTLVRADEFVGKLAADLDLQHNDRLFIVSPTPSKASLKNGDWLTPVAMAGADVARGTVLTSPSTRRPGIIMNTDLAPTVLEFFGVRTPETMSGRPSTTVRVSGQSTYIAELRQQTLFVHNTRIWLIKTYLVYVLILIVASVLLILMREQQLAKKLWLYPLLLSILSFPAACILVPLIGAASPAVYVAGLVAITAALTMLTIIFEQRRPLAGFVFISLVTVFLILTDTFTGNVLLGKSILSYDPIAGARFYGIGNEYMGILIGAAIFGGTCVLTNWPRRVTLYLIGLSWLLIIMTLGTPTLGANFGGLLTATVAFPVTFLMLSGVRFNWRVVALIAAALALIPAFFAVLDLLRSQGAQSHIGRNLFLALRDPEAVFDIISRKMSMNYKLFRYTIWSRILAVGIGGLLLLFYRPVGVMRLFRSRYPHLFTGFIGVVVAVVAAFAFNDSGTVASSTVTIFGITPLLYIFLKES